MLSGLRIWHCGVGRRHGSELALLWLWCRLVATAPMRPLAWENPYAVGVALKRQKTKKEEGREKGREGGKEREKEKEKGRLRF